uniref:Uncharacterized protein n=1 Tax=Pseudo-nitzschia australis TaxID=44445 RepID=A0A7S4ALM3_9STRA
MFSYSYCYIRLTPPVNNSWSSLCFHFICSYRRNITKASIMAEEPKVCSCFISCRRTVNKLLPVMVCEALLMFARTIRIGMTVEKLFRGVVACRSRDMSLF